MRHPVATVIASFAGAATAAVVVVVVRAFAFAEGPQQAKRSIYVSIFLKIELFHLRNLHHKDDIINSITQTAVFILFVEKCNEIKFLFLLYNIN